MTEGCCLNCGAVHEVPDGWEVREMHCSCIVEGDAPRTDLGTPLVSMDDPRAPFAIRLREARQAYEAALLPGTRLTSRHALKRWLGPRFNQ